MIHKQLLALGIEQRHLEQCRLPKVEEAVLLQDAGVDVFDRPVQMTPNTHKHWLQLKAAAQSEDIDLQLVSAFRSVEYQCALIQNKLTAGQKLDDILKVNAIPGYSEHHTGRALDLTTPDSAPLETQFESTLAFRWLSRHADAFQFNLSYPKHNALGIDYEPWHWTFQGIG